MSTNEKSFGQNFGSLAVGALATLIFVNGTISLVPDAILRDMYGDIRGIFVLALCISGLAVFAVACRSFENFMGWSSGPADKLD